MAWTMAAVVVPNMRAMPDKVSPRLTMYVVPPAGAVVIAGSEGIDVNVGAGAGWVVPPPVVVPGAVTTDGVVAG